MITACIDGFNLAMPHGTGIATYGHTLLEGIANIGARGQVLYGPSVGRQETAVMDEVAVIASTNRSRKGGFARALSTRTARFGRNAHAITPSDQVIWPTDGMRRPRAEAYWLAHEIFYLANRAYHQHGTITPVRFDAGRSGIATPDVMHWTCPMPLHAPQTTNILTVHDIIPLKLPHTTKEQKPAYYRQLKASCERADHIICVSEHTKRDLLEVCAIADDKVSVTYQPVIQPEAGDRDADAEWLTNNLGLEPEGFFLFYGAIEPKKNLGRIVEAYLESRSKTPLVIVGGRSWLDEYETGLLNSVLEHGNSKIIKLDYMPRSVLDRLIRTAKATLFPSLYEGFGLPALESMAAGTPILASSGHALEEVVGNAGVVVDPYDPVAIQRAITQLDSDMDLRRDLKVLGAERSNMFSAQNYRQRLESVYRTVGLL